MAQQSGCVNRKAVRWNRKKVMGKEARDILVKIKRGDKGSLTRLKQNIKTNESINLIILI